MTVEWINCKVALPTDDELKLIWVTANKYHKDMVWVAWYDGKDWRFKEYKHNEATHWAEMPEGPNKNECNE